MMFGAKPLIETAMIEEKLKGDSPFMLAYSGGRNLPNLRMRWGRRQPLPQLFHHRLFP
jgi:hypothetical protein